MRVTSAIPEPRPSPETSVCRQCLGVFQLPDAVVQDLVLPPGTGGTFQRNGWSRWAGILSQFAAPWPRRPLGPPAFQSRPARRRGSMPRRRRLIQPGDRPRGFSVNRRPRHLHRGGADRAPEALTRRHERPAGKPALPVPADPASKLWGYLRVRPRSLGHQRPLHLAPRSGRLQDERDSQGVTPEAAYVDIKNASAVPLIMRRSPKAIRCVRPRLLEICLTARLDPGCDLKT